MALTSLTVMQANKQADKKAFLRIVPEREDPAVLPHEDAFRAMQLPKSMLAVPFLALGLGVLALAVVLSWVGFSQKLHDVPLLPLVAAVLVVVLLAVLFFARKPADQATEQDFLDAYRAARAGGARPVPAHAVKVWRNIAEGSLLIYVVLLQLPSGQLLVRHTTGAAEPFEAPAESATFYAWELPGGWTVVQAAKRTA